MRKFEGLSDFFRNTTDDEKREVYLEVIQKANEMQDKVIEEAKLEKGTTKTRTPISTERPIQSEQTHE